ncbi:MAG: hypothetical protein US30_C0005G0009 [Candidatus Moranbacteria bacterium GW2011_GWF2_36_839]|nr:MAG: hypothetical protein US27_C0005G0045 [Candidatus Moranbacteria bacterium GW2011_GWF1_36_78]KKQ17196.1 MAG: hypothetical protein US30_C0005G0009 [Candidatus Moranbacteria bacterium GW2011_GWF2_36_839]HAT73715.1 hypothetical protein [Candidatus Moranbacteria bacterium]HBY11296.1 hypothetical protein [Candidatus Moranbacteria bacterium]
MCAPGYKAVGRQKTYGIPLDPKGEVRRIRGEEFFRPIGDAEAHHPRFFYNPSSPDILRPEPKKK